MSIAESIKKIAGKQSVADIGKVISVNEEKETCEVEIVGMADVVEGVRLSVAGKNKLGLLIVPKVNTDVAVVWVNGVIPVVVSVAEPEKVMWRGEDMFERLNDLIDEFNKHTHEVTSTPTLANGAGTVEGTISNNVQAPSNKVEVFIE